KQNRKTASVFAAALLLIFFRRRQRALRNFLEPAAGFLTAKTIARANFFKDFNFCGSLDISAIWR
ncbi:MAG TPA: hypothetical protein PKK37_04530, partial [Candidatus Pacearchaeota archaeon]|nr:hypothetical protein [Candidatus Pacearchaeota archaeon]